MLVFSRAMGERTGHLAINSYQFSQLVLEREAAMNNQGMNVMQEIANRINLSSHLNGINAVRSPVDLYRTFDQTVLAEFQNQDEFALLTDLTPLSRSVRINATVYEYAKSGGQGNAHTSMSGQVGALLNATVYDYDGTMVPVHDTGSKFNWRDPRLNNPDAFDVISDAQANDTRTIRRKYVDYLFEGYRDSEGNYVQFDGKTWKGLRHDERVAQVTLTVNLATSTDPKAMRSQVIALRDVVRVTNKQYGQQTWYVSQDIMSNWEQDYSDNYAAPSLYEKLLKLNGIAAIKVDSKLSGNELLIVPLQAGVIAPIVGQAFGTVADPRPLYNSDYVWRTWGAAGLMVKTDIQGHYSVVHASS